MILTAPAMISGHSGYESGRSYTNKKGALSANVIKRFVDHPTVFAMRAFPANVPAEMAAAGATEAAVSKDSKTAVVTGSGTAVVKGSEPAVTKGSETAVAKISEVSAIAVVKAPGKIVEETPADKPATAAVTTKTAASKAADAKAVELRMVIRQAAIIYTAMDLESTGLDQKAFEYAWRGYHNLVKKGIIRKRTVLSICDFSQPSRNKRMYVIDVENKRLLYRTYVAHGQNSGDEYASNFSNEEDSYMSSLGFYVTQRTYMGRNGLSLRLNGVDPGYNDKAMKRKIVLHGSSYAGERYMQDYGNLGTSLGCPALPVEVSGRIIRTVKGGSCLFIYHPTQQYLDNSTVLHG